MKKSLFIFLIFSTTLFSQSNSVLDFENLKLQIEQNKIEFDSIGISEEKLNQSEIRILELLNNNLDILDTREITFISGSSGTTISSKITFFNSFKYYYAKYNRLPVYNIVRLTDEDKKL